jgi:hypothetical protein
VENEAVHWISLLFDKLRYRSSVLESDRDREIRVEPIPIQTYSREDKNKKLI